MKRTGLAAALAGPGQRSRGRNLGQTVDNIQEKTKRYPRNFIHFKEISITIIFKMFLHKQMIWFKDLENNKILSLQFYNILSTYNAKIILFSTHSCTLITPINKYYIVSEKGSTCLSFLPGPRRRTVVSGAGRGGGGCGGERGNGAAVEVPLSFE